MLISWACWRFHITNMLTPDNVCCFIPTKAHFEVSSNIFSLISAYLSKNSNRLSSLPVAENDSNFSSYDDTPLGLISTIGCGASIIAILVMIFIFIATNLNDSRHIIHMNLGGAILGQK